MVTLHRIKEWFIDQIESGEHTKGVVVANRDRNGITITGR